MKTLVLKFEALHIGDVAEVGGKNASLGEMFNELAPKGVPIPNGFAVTATAFWHFIDQNQLRPPLENLMKELDRVGYSNLAAIGKSARALIINGKMPDDLAKVALQAYADLGNGNDIDVAVRSSATAEDLPNASFAGQHESFLNICGATKLLQAVQQCYASLYTDRAIKYREDNHFDHSKVALSVGIQKMVRADKGCSGVGFTLEPESGFRDLIHLSGVWGLGENMVQGTVTPDEFFIFKPSLLKGKRSIIQKRLGEKAKTMIYSEDEQSITSTINIDTPPEKRVQYVLSDGEVSHIAKWALLIEMHYNRPMDIEWAKDGFTNELFILQARPETVHGKRDQTRLKEYVLDEKGSVLAQGDAIGSTIASGIARVITSPKDAERLQTGDIIITEMTSPDWDPLLKKCAAIVTDKGGRTSHASIVARELGVPAVVGTANATRLVQDGEWITVSCAEGKTGTIYQGKLKFHHVELDITGQAKPTRTKPMLIVGDPGKAFQLSFYPNEGVGLMRIEFVITHFVQVHPIALVKFDELQDKQVQNAIQQLTSSYPNKEAYFVDKLSQGIATIAAAFYPKDVLVRMSDFKTNEYADLIGGRQFEPMEENPMLGFRGASRYYNDLYKEGFRMECEAVKIVRYEMGLTNVKVMIPFCRTVEEGRKVVDVMRENGLDRDNDKTLEIYMMAEIPSNVLLAERFAEIFDGFSIGSNDLTQLTLGIDRDSSLVSNLFNEQNEAVKEMISMVIKKAKAAGIKIGLCGQAPSDFPEFAQFLVEQGVDSISFNADALLKGIENIRKAELT